MKITDGMCQKTRPKKAVGWSGGRFFANIIWPCHSARCATSRANCANASKTLDRLARRRLPALRLLIALGVAVERALEISQRDDEARPAVDKTQFENIMFEKRPQPVAKRYE